MQAGLPWGQKLLAADTTATCLVVRRDLGNRMSRINKNATCVKASALEGLGQHSDNPKGRPSSVPIVQEVHQRAQVRWGTLLVMEYQASLAERNPISVPRERTTRW